jgi:hypothetical protein
MAQYGLPLKECGIQERFHEGLPGGYIAALNLEFSLAY